MKTVKYDLDANFNQLKIPLPLMYFYTMGRIKKSVFLSSVFFYNLFISHKQYGFEHNSNFIIKPKNLLEELSLNDGEYSKEIKEFFAIKQAETVSENKLIKNFRERKQKGIPKKKEIIKELNISIPDLIDLCSDIKNIKNIERDTFKKHSKFMGSKSDNQRPAYTQVDSDFFDYIQQNKLNKIKLRVFLLIIRKKQSTYYMRKPVYYSYLKEYTNTVDLKRIIKHTEDLHNAGIITITNRDDFDCTVPYLNKEKLINKKLDQEIMDMI